MLRLGRAVLAVRGHHVTLGRLQRRGSVFSFVCVAGFCFFDYWAGEKSNPTGAFVAVRRFVARYLLETLESLVLPTRRNKKTARIIYGKNQRERERERECI